MERDSRMDARIELAIGSDHGGFLMKQHLIRTLGEDLDIGIHDQGCFSPDSVDYPDIAVAVGTTLQRNSCTFGVMIDGAGVGSTMVLNRLPGIRAALCHDPFTTINSRAHNNANVLVLGSNVVHSGEAVRLVKLWLKTPFEAGRHLRRVEKINALDRSNL